LSIEFQIFRGARQDHPASSKTRPDSEIGTEQFFAISDDLQHDRFFVAEVQ
jgi:hypothetical protein